MNAQYEHPTPAAEDANVWTDPSAQRWLRHYGRNIYRRAVYILKDPTEAEEVVQEVLLKALAYQPSLNSESTLGWFFRVTTNHCLNRQRDAARRAELLTRHFAPHQGHPKQPTLSEAMLAHWLLSNAEPRQALCAAYIYLEGHSHDETAELLDVSLRTVHNLLARFRAWAKEAVEADAQERGSAAA